MTPAYNETIGVIVMAHGTPESLGDIEAFYTHIRRGQAPSAEQLADLVSRYHQIGGVSPLAELTRAQVKGLDAKLAQVEPNRYVVELGTKHSSPTLEDGARRLIESGVEEVVGLVLTPHFSSAGTGEYMATVGEVFQSEDVLFHPINQWHETEGFAELIGTRVRQALQELHHHQDPPPAVVFTAHSVPKPAPEAADPYVSQVQESAQAAAQQAGLLQTSSWRVAWQSGRGGSSSWIGPPLSDVMVQLAHDGATAVVVCPIGFVADHLEVLYDLDIEARQIARGVGLDFARTRSLNDDPGFLDVLARTVVDHTTPAGRHDDGVRTAQG